MEQCINLVIRLHHVRESVGAVWLSRLTIAILIWLSASCTWLLATVCPSRMCPKGEVRLEEASPVEGAGKIMWLVGSRVPMVPMDA